MLTASLLPGPHGPGVQHGLVGVRQVPGHGLQGRQAQDLLPAPELPPAARGRRHRGQEGRPGGVGLQGEVPRHHRLQQTVRAPDHGLADQVPSTETLDLSPAIPINNIA